MSLGPLGWLLAFLGSFLPARWRERRELSGAPLAVLGAIGAVGELGLAVWLMAVQGMAYVARQDELLSAAGIDRQGRSFFTVAALVAFLVATPWGWATLYLLVEGLVRLAAGVMGQPLGSFALWSVERLIQGGQSRRAEKDAGPLLADDLRLTPGEGGEIWSCRLRGWDDLTTLRIDDVLYRVEELKERGGGLRRFVYRLGPLPRGWVLRKVVDYDPELIVRELSVKR